jgi:hypothetical protein
VVGVATVSVLLEALSVVLRAATLDGLDETAPDVYGRFIADDSYRTDGRLAAVSFRSPHDVAELCDALVAAGLVLDAGEAFVDVAVVDQSRGPTRGCDWLDCYAHDDGYALCCLAGEDPGDMAAYEGWSPDERPELEYISMGEMGERLRFLRREGDRDVFLDLESGEEVFIQRPA